MVSRLTKDQLRKVLAEHGVSLPPVSAKKEELVKLYEEHVGEREESSDDEIAFNPARISAQTSTTELDISTLDDDSLTQLLQDQGVDVGPIVASTRSFYKKKLSLMMTGSQFSSGMSGSDTEEEDDQPSGVTVRVDGDQKMSPAQTSLRQRMTRLTDHVDSPSHNRSVHNYKVTETKKEVVTRTRDGVETRDKQHTIEREELDDPHLLEIKKKRSLASKMVKLVLISLILVVIYLIITTKTEEDEVEKVISSVQSHQHDLPDRDPIPDASNVADI